MDISGTDISNLIMTCQVSFIGQKHFLCIQVISVYVKLLFFGKFVSGGNNSKFFFQKDLIFPTNIYLLKVNNRNT